MFIIQAANLPISAKIYAALDAREMLCWTDDERRAARFASEAEASAFGSATIDGDDWVVRRA